MKKEQDKWAESLRNRMKDYSEPLSEGLWERIEHDLPASRVLPFWRPRRFAVAAAVAVVAVSSVSIWFMTSSRLSSIDAGQDIAEMLTVPTAVSATDDVKPVDSEVLSEEVQRSAEKLLATRRVASNAEPMLLASVSAVISEEVDEKAISEAENINVASEQEDSSNAVERKSWRKQVESDRRQMERNRRDWAESKKRTRKSSWSFGVAAANTPSSSASVSETDYLLSRTAMSGALLMASSPNIFSSNSQTVSGYESERKTEMDYKMPVSVGASVKWNINDLWALESGLYYTYLASEINNQSKPKVEEKQKLHYIGIPLKVQRTFWKNRRWAVYASTGFMLEKCVKATRDISFSSGNISSYELGKHTSVASGIPVVSGIQSFVPKHDGEASWDYTPAASQGEEHTSFHVNQLQCSASLSAGVQFNLAKRVGLYVEPGATYYFNDGSGIETIRKEHPLNFSLQMGIRFDVSK